MDGYTAKHSVSLLVVIKNVKLSYKFVEASFQYIYKYVVIYMWMIILTKKQALKGNISRV